MEKIWDLLLRFRRLILLMVLVSLLIGLGILIVDSLSKEGIKRYEESLSVNGRSAFFLAEDKKADTFESRSFKAPSDFNAIALHWKEENISHEDMRQVFLKTSTNEETWTEWMELDSLDPLRGNDHKSERTFPEVPLFINGRFFQYKIILSRDSLSVPSPRLFDIKVTYINSQTSSSQKIMEKLENLFSPVKAAEQGPKIISRGAWGSPDPYGKLFKGTGRYWKPTYSPVKQIFVHHTVFNNTSDPAAAVRAIWEYHTYTRGWGDIGYNYLVDQNGNIYQGRFGGDNVVAGHVFGFNIGSMGVAALGCFETSSSSCDGAPPPSSAMIDTLTTLLAWKSTNYEINPNTTHTFCGSSSCLNLWTIAGHKDASSTACPGNLLYNQLSDIRSETADKKGSWNYSAKQTNFGSIGFSTSDTDKSITLGFKNTGTSTWSNTTNRMLLKTANPIGRTSSFQGSNWVDDQTPAVLNEATVAPGETGTFTFNLQNPSPTRGDYMEAFRLALEGDIRIPQMFTLQLQSPTDVLVDAATFYDYGDCETRIHAFISKANRFSYQGPGGWWSSTGYCASSIPHAVSGDFDGDGDDDLATYYDYGNNETRIHVFKTNVSSFEYQGPGGWWSATNYDISKVRYVLSDDFDNDGKDDLAAYHDYGNNEARIHVWLSSGNSFVYQGSEGWWKTTGYWLSRTTGSTVGDFNNDKRADLAMFYDYGSGRARIHVWLSTGSSFRYQGSDGWWQATGYHLSRTSGLTNGFFNINNGHADLAMFYDYGSGRARIHVWLSTGSSFRYQGSDGWWQATGYHLKAVKFALSGFFDISNETNREDIVTVYDYPGSETRIHAFTSTGGRYFYHGSQGWWSTTGYDTKKVKKAVSGYFGR